MRKDDVKTEQDLICYLESWSEFERAVYVATYRVPHGRVTTYQRVAGTIGRPKAMRAVANTLHNNPLYPVVPCWRVVRSDGGFGGEVKGASARRDRVMSEGVPVRDGRVILSDDVLF